MLINIREMWIYLKIVALLVFPQYQQWSIFTQPVYRCVQWLTHGGWTKMVETDNKVDMVQCTITHTLSISLFTAGLSYCLD